jgi:hypothetical protein
MLRMSINRGKMVSGSGCFMKQIVLICRGWEKNRDLCRSLQALFPECEIKILRATETKAGHSSGAEEKVLVSHEDLIGRFTPK